ncbi:hypothetical protein ACXYMT_04215 [Salinimicrobium sp. CAU 1759]
MVLNYFHTSLLIFLAFTFSQSVFSQVIDHRLSFETSEGIYGHVIVKSKPVELGASYVVLDAKSLVIEGKRGQSKIYGFSFPLQVGKFTLNLSGSACIYLNSSQPHCGNFQMNYLSSATSDYTSVGFSEDSKTRYKNLIKEDKSLSWESNGFVKNIQVDKVNSDIFRKIEKAVRQSASNNSGNKEKSGNTAPYSSTEADSYTNGESESGSNSANTAPGSGSESNDTESSSWKDDVDRQIEEQTRINNARNEAYAEAASIAAEGLAQGLSEGLITGMTLSYNMRSDESIAEGAVTTVLNVPTYELGIQMGENANSGFTIGYGPGGAGIIYDTGSSYTYVTGLDIGILNWGELGGSYAFQFSIGGEFGIGAGEYTDGGYYRDDVDSITDDVTFYGGHLNAKLMKYFFAGYGYGLASGSYSSNGDFVDYEISYSKLTLGLRIPL